MKTLKQLLDEAGVPEFVLNSNRTKVFRAVDITVGRLPLSQYTYLAGQIWWTNNLTKKEQENTHGPFFLFTELCPPKIDGWELAEPLPRYALAGESWAEVTDIRIPDIRQGRNTTNQVWIMKKSAPKFYVHIKPTPEWLAKYDVELDGDEPRPVVRGSHVVSNSTHGPDIGTPSDIYMATDSFQSYEREDGKRWHVKPVQNPPKLRYPQSFAGKWWIVAEAKPRLPRTGEYYFTTGGNVIVAEFDHTGADDSKYRGRRWILKPQVTPIEETDDTESSAYFSKEAKRVLAGLVNEIENGNITDANARFATLNVLHSLGF